MNALVFIETSPCVDAVGWVDVDASSSRHTRFLDMWALGDTAGTSDANTAAAVRLQAPVVVSNLVAVLDNKHRERQFAEVARGLP